MCDDMIKAAQEPSDFARGYMSGYEDALEEYGVEEAFDGVDDDTEEHEGEIYDTEGFYEGEIPPDDYATPSRGWVITAAVILGAGFLGTIAALAFYACQCCSSCHITP